ncbi:MAG: hypothetical protein GTO18_11525 [Anaerolineales bacterium]|nr:hypothetical protein [Anaerolineales bacterium]
MLYSLQLVFLTLLLPIIGLGSFFFLVSAFALGFGFIAYAWRLWRVGGNRVAWGMYQYSSGYLALIFVILVLDTILR